MKLDRLAMRAPRWEFPPGHNDYFRLPPLPAALVTAFLGEVGAGMWPLKEKTAEI